MQQVGLEELANISQVDLATDFMPSAVAGLADGDIAVFHEPYYDKQAELYGENHYGDGRVAKAIARTAIENGMAPGLIYDFQDFAVGYATASNSPVKITLPVSAVRIYQDAVTIDGNPLIIARTPSVILDYGACLTGRSYITDQMRFAKVHHQRPFTYSPLTRLHFTNEALIKTYDANYGLGTANLMIENQLYIGREDGVANATNEIIRAQTAHGATAEIADIVLCTSSRHTAAADLKLGIRNARSLLKEGGLLIVRSLAYPAADELGTDVISGWAYEAGFEEKKALHYEAGLDKIGTLLLTGHFGEREIHSVVFTK